MHMYQTLFYYYQNITINSNKINKKLFPSTVFTNLTNKRNLFLSDGLKLCDFGISRVVENGSKVREILGTPDYVAPEVLQYEPLSLKTDIWSVGVLAYVLLTGFTPFGGDSKQETFLNISQCALTFPDDLFDGISNHALDFIKCTLRIKPQ